MPLTRRTYPNATGSFELWEQVVRDIVGQPTAELSLLDLCCNECTVTSRLGCYHHVATDIVDWPTRPKHIRFAPMDLRTWSPVGRGFDLCICSDGIEHFTKEEGWKLLAGMEVIAHLAIIFTPLGHYMVEPGSTHPDKHQSGWEPEELEALGWQTRCYPRWHEALGVGAFFAHKGKLTD